MTQHQFALFASEATQAAQRQSHMAVTVPDASLAHRVYRVLRLSSGDMVIFFDRTHALQVQLLERPNTGVAFRVMQATVHAPSPVYIHALLPVLKKEALNAAVYALVQAGARTIQLIRTQRSYSVIKGVKLLDRLERVAIAAAEQSKQFVLPTIEPPVTLEDAIVQVSAATRLFADPSGEPLLSQQIGQEVAICVGPEADLTDQEKSILRDNGFIPCALTRSILRAEQAIALLGWLVSMR